MLSPHAVILRIRVLGRIDGDKEPEESWFDTHQGHEIYPSSRMPRPPPGHTQQ
jgi:hypothetical protein